ncbi:MAG: hypothetical protein P1U90_17120 [Akkermansiaceae bacterium]|jgi:hypothetical protein|nr:hypothetical protein [Akkermansiaceae bacterium]
MKGKSQSSDASRTSMASTKADLRELKANSSATVQELQEFLRDLKGKSPQEMLGAVASSQLFQATLLSIILVIIAIFTLTAIPYFLGDQTTPDPGSPIVTAPVSSAPAPREPETSPQAKPKDGEALAPLGVNEKKTAPANVNPLEDNGSNFLKDLE